MKHLHTTFVILFSFFAFNSFSQAPKPHLIVGNWQLIENEKTNIVFSMDEKNYFIERLTFSSDEIESEFTLIDKKNKTERELTFGYHVFDPFGEFKNSVILFKNICDKKSRVVFSIISLDKGYLKVQFEQRHTSDGINISTGIMTFERTAGPPENMP